MRFVLTKRPEGLCLSGSGLPRPDEGSSGWRISFCAMRMRHGVPNKVSRPARAKKLAQDQVSKQRYLLAAQLDTRSGSGAMRY